MTTHKPPSKFCLGVSALLYASRRQPTPAFALLVDDLRYRGERRKLEAVS